jgi:hypothetical protein
MHSNLESTTWVSVSDGNSTAFPTGEIWSLVSRTLFYNMPPSVVSVSLSCLNRVGEDKVETKNDLDQFDAKDGRIVLHATPGGRNSNRLCLAVGVSGTQGITVEALISSLWYFRPLDLLSKKEVDLGNPRLLQRESVQNSLRNSTTSNSMATI